MTENPSEILGKHAIAVADAGTATAYLQEYIFVFFFHLLIHFRVQRYKKRMNSFCSTLYFSYLCTKIL